MSQAGTIARGESALLLVDLQARLMPAIEGGATVVANARRLRAAAALLGVPAVVTEQNPAGLGPTVPELETAGLPVLHKMSFDACRAPGFSAFLPDRELLVVAGCEAHVCVLQTVLGLLGAGRRVAVVRDATGSRRAENREAAVRRMERHGAEIVTTEMAVFEWLGTAEDRQFRDCIRLIR